MAVLRRHTYHLFLFYRPKRPVTLNQGQNRSSWFDMTRLPPRCDEYDEFTTSESITQIENIILSQVHCGIDSRRIALVGFSQGAALSMMVALTSLHELGGVACLSGWIPHPFRYVSVPFESSYTLW